MKLHFPALGQFTLRRSPLWVPTRRLTNHSTTTRPAHEPLKIAFFGSDDFSVASLAKLTQYQSTTTHHTPSPIESIHVITRSIKPTGRNMKAMVDLPIGKYAASQGIPVSRADTATEILDVLSQHEFNLVVAVSYGRLIPAQFIAQCRYGGLNVHPSLLPTYAGSSPLQYALLNDDASTGCTVQTLHPTKFDHGDVLLQSGEIPISGSDNLASLFDKFGEIGGDLLVRTIDQGLFVDPKPVVNDYVPSLAPKISKSRSQALWDELSARQIKRVWDALGPVFTFINVNLVRKRKPISGKQRVILLGVSEFVGDDEARSQLTNPGDFTLGKEGLIIKAKEGYVVAKSIKMQAQAEESPESFMGTYKKKVGDTPKQFIN